MRRLRRIDKQRVGEVEEVIKEKISIEKFIHDNGLGTVKGRVLKCPFHDDEIPSMFIDDDKGLWKCHSCGRGGGFIKLYMYVEDIIEGRKLNYYEIIDKIIMKFNLQSLLGFNSVFIEERNSLNIEDLKLRDKVVIGEIVPTVEILCNRIKDLDIRKDIIMDIQTGLPEGVIVKKYYNIFKGGKMYSSIEDILLDRYL